MYHIMKQQIKKARRINPKNPPHQEKKISESVILYSYYFIPLCHNQPQRIKAL